MRVDSRFAGYDRSELTATRGQFVLRKAQHALNATLTRVAGVAGQPPTFTGREAK